MQQVLRAVLDLFGHQGFLNGLAAGLLGAALLSIASLIIRRPPLGWGVVYAGACTFGLTAWAGSGVDLGWRLLLLAAVGLLIDRVAGRDLSVHPLVMIGGWVVAGLAAWVFLGRDVPEVGWISYVFPMTVAVVGMGIWALRRHPSADLVGPMLVISIGGVWVTVPETDLVNVMLGAALPMGLVTLPPVRARATAAGALALSGLVAWLALEGGIPRPWTVATAWWTLATIPLIGFLVHTPQINLRRGSLFAVHVVYVAAVTRLADVTESEVVVLLGSVLLIVLAALGLFFMSWLRKTDR